MAQVGPMLGPSWLQLGSSWAHVVSIYGSPAAPGPTQALPDPFPRPSTLFPCIKEATPHSAGPGRGGWGRSTTQGPRGPSKPERESSEHLHLQLQKHLTLASSDTCYILSYFILILYYSKRLRPIPPGLGSRIWNLGRCLLEPCWSLLGSKLGVVEV